YIETESGMTSNIKSSLDWCVEDYKSDDNFKKDGIYRIKGRLSKSCDNNIYVTEIISENEKNDFLENLLTEYKKEVSVNSAVLGKLILDKKLNWYKTESDIEWCGGMAGFSISCKQDNINEILPVAENFYRNRHEWDIKARKYASGSLTELANDWQYQEAEDENEVIEITEKEFAERLEINDISFYSDGNFDIYYADDDMFWGHTVIVSGNISTGFNEAYF
ncbi:MAG: DUF2262 domain-containing protein, partial [Ruminococcus sp.]|nr:DUF2262 domain-containing protein [Ruminococcus sp.]